MALHVLLGATFAAAAAWVALGTLGGRTPTPDALRLRLLRRLRAFGTSPVGQALCRQSFWARLRTTLEAKGLVLEEPVLAGLVLVAMGAGCLLCAFVTGTPLGVLFGLVMEVVGLVAWVSSEERGRQRARAHEIPDVLRSLASGMGAGQTLSQAIAYVGNRGSGDVARAFRHAAMEIHCGVAADRALAQAMESIDEPGIDLAAVALTVSQRTGAPLDDLLSRSAALVEEQHGLALLLKTKTAQVRLSAAVVMGLPVVIVTLLMLISPDFRAGIATPVGLGCVIIAAGLDGLALMTMAKIMAKVDL